MTSFEKFGDNFQSKIIYHIITNSDFAIQILDVIKPEFFSNENYRTLITMIIRWNDKYRTIPSFDNLNTLSMKVYKDDDIMSEFMTTMINDIKNNTTTNDMEHIIDETVEFCRQQAFRNAVLESVDLVKNEQYDGIESLFQYAMSAGMKKDLGHDYFADVNSRVLQRRNPIATGFPMFDGYISGGLSGGDLGIILAGTGVGKSMVLTFMAADAVRQGKKVLYFTFELSELLVGLRLDAKVTGIPLTNLLTDIDGGLRTRIANRLEEMQKTSPSSQLKIKFWPTGTATISMLYNYILQLQHVGFVPDIIFVDYLDLIKPTHFYKDKRYELQGITEELRGMAGTKNIPMWSASQTNREGWDSSIVGLKTISESSAKAFVADLVLSIGRGQRLVDEGRACYYIAKSRLGPDKIPFTGEFDTSILNFTIDSEGFDEEEIIERDRGRNINRAIDNIRNEHEGNRNNNNLNEVLRGLNLNTGGQPGE